MDVTTVTPHPFRMTACVPDEMVSLDAADSGSAWSGAALWAGPADGGGRPSVALVSIDVAPLRPGAAEAVGERLRAALQERSPGDAGVVEEFRTAAGHPALRVSAVVTQQRGGRAVTTGQAQVLVLFTGALALGVVSAVCPDPADLERAAALVSGIAAQLSVTATSAAA